MLLFLLAATSGAGTSVTDIDFKLSNCPDGGFTFFVRKSLGGSSSTEPLTWADVQDLVADCTTSASACDSTATSILGSWYTSIPSTGSDPGKTTFRDVFVKLGDVD